MLSRICEFEEIRSLHYAPYDIWVDIDGCKQVLHQGNHLIKSHAQHHPWHLDWLPSKLQLDHHGNYLQEALHGAPCQEVTPIESLFHHHSLPVSQLQRQTLHQAMALCQVSINLREVSSLWSVWDSKSGITMGFWLAFFQHLHCGSMYYV